MFKRWLRARHKRRGGEIFPNEILLDSAPSLDFDKDQFEGRLVKPIKGRSIIALFIIFFLLAFVYAVKAYDLQLAQGEAYAKRSENNTLRREVVFAERGLITDRNDIPLAWNTKESDELFAKRAYISDPGFSHLLGYVKYPKQDKKGIFYSYETEGQSGIEKYFEEKLEGMNGIKLTEVSVEGEVESENTLEKAQPGEKLTLSIDSRAQKLLYELLHNAVTKSDFEGGAGVLMDSNTGEVIAMASIPEFDSNVMSEGADGEKISNFLTSSKSTFLNRAVSGLYAPGSIVKPFIGLGALNEKIIDPSKKIQSTGSISVPNPYDPSKPSIFRDWRAHGWTNIEEAIAVSSDVYFYSVGGGYGDQKGMGIDKIHDYISSFLFGKKTSGFFDGPNGVVPSREWKKKTFGEDWLLGNTYHTSIGQYGFQVTPLQVARAMTGIANEGVVVEPVITKGDQGDTTKIPISIDKKNYGPIKDGMRLAVVTGTARALNTPAVEVAAKTGTAEVGAGKRYVNSWVAGYFPYKDPHYTFAVVLEKGPTTYPVSAMQVAGGLISKLAATAPDAIGIKNEETAVLSDEVLNQNAPELGEETIDR